jgi:hypothetical protein
MKGGFYMKGRRETTRAENKIDDQVLNLEQKRIAEWLAKVRFRKRFFGGVSEQDVWQKIEELNALYEAALIAEHIRYDTMIDHYKKTCAATADNCT